MLKVISNKIDRTATGFLGILTAHLEYYMQNFLNLMNDIVYYGQRRETRSGVTLSLFDRKLSWNMNDGLPVPTTKRLPINLVIGELLWFLNGETGLPSLRKRSLLAEGANTIWSADCLRWNTARGIPESEDTGKLYGHMWRNYGGELGVLGTGVDQIQDLVTKMMTDTTSRYLTVTAYDPLAISKSEMALPACHTGFVVYVDAETKQFDLKWRQRSVDTFLGLAFNIASYGVLMEILGSITGLNPRYLSCDLDDVHVYEAHLDAVYTQLERTPVVDPVYLDFHRISSLEDLMDMTAADFNLPDYHPMPSIKAPLLVG